MDGLWEGCVSDLIVVSVSGVVARWDSYALQGRGMPDGWRLATPVEAYLCRQLCELEERLEALERRTATPTEDHP